MGYFGTTRAGPESWLQLSGLPETIIFRTIFETYRAQFLKKLGFIYAHVFAQFVQGRVEIPEFHVDEAHQHHRIVWYVAHSVYLLIFDVCYFGVRGVPCNCLLLSILCVCPAFRDMQGKWLNS